jgi:hypothetical protein
LVTSAVRSSGGPGGFSIDWTRGEELLLERVVLLSGLPERDDEEPALGRTGEVVKLARRQRAVGRMSPSDDGVVLLLGAQKWVIRKDMDLLLVVVCCGSVRVARRGAIRRPGMSLGEQDANGVDAHAVVLHGLGARR